MSNVIAADFKHGANFKCGENVIIEPDVVVGDNVTLGHQIVLKSGTRFGSNINFADYCCTTGACILGDNINVRTNTVVSKGVIVEDKAYLGPGIMTNHTKHITHQRPKLKGQFYVTRVSYGAVIGASCWIMAGVYVGPNVIIGGGTLVVKNIINPGIYVGTPPRILKVLTPEWIVEGSSKRYDFEPKIIEKYLPGVIELEVK